MKLEIESKIVLAGIGIGMELELIPLRFLEWELELIPKSLPGIGIGINSIFFGISKCL